MGCPLPRVAGTLSDSAKLKFSNINSQLAELKFLPVIVEDFANLNAWTEVDADGKVNLSGGVITFDGGNTINDHGIWYTAGIARAVGCLELKAIIPNLTHGISRKKLLTCSGPSTQVGER